MAVTVRLGAVLVLLLASCGEDPQRNAPEPPAKADPTVPAEGISRSGYSTRAPAANAEGAADTARLYFDHLANGRYDAAWRLRWKNAARSEAERAAFAAHFESYQRYAAQVGPARPAQRSNGSDYVDIPVQLSGRRRDGGALASAGMVTLRRDLGSNEGWRIYPGE